VSQMDLKRAIELRKTLIQFAGLGPFLSFGVSGCSVYTSELLDNGTASNELEPAGIGGSLLDGSGGQGTGGAGTGGAEMAAAGGAGETASGGAGTGGESASGGASDRGDCEIAPAVEPSTLPACSAMGHTDPSDGDVCAPGDDCADEVCGFAGLGTKTCVCKTDGTLNCSCSRPSEYLGRCPADEASCTSLNHCVRGPSCADLDLENAEPERGTRAAMEGDLCENEWDQCVTVDAPTSDGCVCSTALSSLPQWVCKNREGWFTPL